MDAAGAARQGGGGERARCPYTPPRGHVAVHALDAVDAVDALNGGVCSLSGGLGTLIAVHRIPWPRFGKTESRPRR